MGTRSAIGIYSSVTKTIHASYCHWDGYWDGVGDMLLKHYTDPRKIDELISHGDISVLDENIYPPKGVRHNFDERHKGSTLFYGRDRGDEDTEYGEYENVQEIIDNIDCAYVYVFSNGHWFGYDVMTGEIRVDGVGVEDRSVLTPALKV